MLVNFKYHEFYYRDSLEVMQGEIEPTQGNNDHTIGQIEPNFENLKF